ncbi:MAG: hypothetical protein DRO67_07465 [Candidatus Asgardarchaeum californiense]|nr:MAG: hypothetical protein DRO67_07465 [Candidatus Asgardarchaeum californiense]
MPKRLLNINVIIFIFRIGNLLMDKKLISWMGVAITNHDFTPRGYQLEKRYFSTFIKADDIAFYVFCPYTTLLKFVESKKAKFPKKLHWEGLHKIHFILHKFGVAPAEEVIAEIKDYERKPKLKEFRELAIKLVAAHKDSVKPNENVLEYVEVRSEALGVHEKIPLVIDNHPVIEYFVEMVLPPSYEDQLRLTLYALLLEEKFNIDIDYGFAEYPLMKVSHKIQIDSDLRKDAITKRAEMEKIIIEKKVDREVPVDIKKCNTCYYQDECPYWRRGKIQFFV